MASSETFFWHFRQGVAQLKGGNEMMHWYPSVGWVGSAVLLLCCVAAVLGEAPAAREASGDKLWVYVGTYTGPKSKGIYRLEMDPATGKLSAPSLAGEVVNPSFLAIHPNRHFLYAVGELNDFAGKKGGAVSAFAIDPKSGDLKLLNQESSGGAGPCHVVVDKQGKHVLAANYTGGNAIVLAIGSDGRLGEQTAFVQHKGKGTDPSRQEAPHAHSINLDPANRFAFVADLGLDQVFSYRYDTDKGTLTANDPPSVHMAPGAGPRHLAFHPSGRYAYVINEMANTVTAMKYDAERGVLTTFQTVPTLPKGVKGNSTAEVQVHPSGKFLYGSNRGHNSIAVFRIDQATGELTPAGQQGEGIKTPRNFGIDPSGKFLVVANQGSDSLVVFRIDPESGELKPTGHKAEVGAPVCVKFLAREK
jgi:6-phosphogluconolactonase